MTESRSKKRLALKTHEMSFSSELKSKEKWSRAKDHMGRARNIKEVGISGLSWVRFP